MNENQNPDSKLKTLASIEIPKDTLRGADLEGANLTGERLEGAKGQAMKITQEELNKKIELHGKWLRHEEGGVRLELPGYDLSGLNLKGANLTGANLEGADLSGATLTGAYLGWVILEWASLRRSNLRGANLAGAKLELSNLELSNFEGANLEGANLTEANLKGANLRRSNLSGANLAGANLEQCRGIIWADCSFYGHGENGRRLSAVLIDRRIKYFCGCFQGSEKDLLKYINHPCDENYKKSRLLAFEFVKERIREGESGQ